MTTDFPTASLGSSQAPTDAVEKSPAPQTQKSGHPLGPQLYRVINIKETKPNEYTISCLQYDTNKYSRIEGGVTVPTNPYFTQPSLVSVSPVTNFQFKQESFIGPEGVVQRNLAVTWSPLSTDFVVRYGVTYSVNNGTVQDLGSAIQQPQVSLPLTVDGVYTVNVVAYNASGVGSTPATSTYTATLSAPTSASPLPAATGLQTTAGSATAWSGPDLNIQWTPGVYTGPATLKDYLVSLEYAAGNVLRTAYTASPSYHYPFAANSADAGGSPQRTVKVSVQERDTNNQLGSALVGTFTNPPPSVPSSITVVGQQNGNLLSWSASASTNTIAGYLVWASETTGFTPSAANLVYQGNATVFLHTNLAKGSTWYYVIAAYDLFGVSLDGTGLNLSGQYTSTATSAVGIPSYGTLPSTASEGDIAFDTADGQLYRWHNGAWTLDVPAVNLTGQVAGTQIAAGTITGNNIAANTITAGNLAANTITAGQIASSTITSSQIAAGTITGSNIAAGAISAANIAANTITSGQIAAGTITSNEIGAATITGNNIAGATITGSNIVAGTITGSLIEANTIDTTNLIVGSVSAPYYSSSSTAFGGSAVSLPSYTAQGGRVVINGTVLIGFMRGNSTSVVGEVQFTVYIGTSAYQYYLAIPVSSGSKYVYVPFNFVLASATGSIALQAVIASHDEQDIAGNYYYTGSLSVGLSVGIVEVRV
jgi:predicted phage tail protein